MSLYETRMTLTIRKFQRDDIGCKFTFPFISFLYFQCVCLPYSRKSNRNHRLLQIQLTDASLRTRWAKQIPVSDYTVSLLPFVHSLFVDVLCCMFAVARRKNQQQRVNICMPLRFFLGIIARLSLLFLRYALRFNQTLQTELIKSLNKRLLSSPSAFRYLEKFKQN